MNCPDCETAHEELETLEGRIEELEDELETLKIEHDKVALTSRLAEVTEIKQGVIVDVRTPHELQTLYAVVAALAKFIDDPDIDRALDAKIPGLTTMEFR